MNLSWSSQHNDQPDIRLFLSNLEPRQIVLIIVAAVLLFIIDFLAFLQFWLTWPLIPVEKREQKFFIIYTMLPLTSACCFLSMLVPRTSAVMTSIAALHVFMCMIVLVSIIRHGINEKALLASELSGEPKRINLRQPPFCCCCTCLPQPKSTVSRLRLLDWSVIQAAVIRAIMTIVYIIVAVEFRPDASSIYVYGDTVLNLSFFLAMFGVNTIISYSADNLKKYCSVRRFRLVVLLLLFLVQKPMFFVNLFAKVGVFKDGTLLNPEGNARFMCSFLMISEFALLSLFITWTIYKRETAQHAPHKATAEPLVRNYRA